MNKLTISALAMIAAAAPALAQDAEKITKLDGLFMAVRVADSDVYVARSDDEWDATTSFDSLNDDWDEAGEADDLVFDAQGQIQGVLMEVGGFLGIGERHVIIPFEDVRIFASPPDSDNYAIVTNLDEDALNALPEVDIDWPD